MFPRGRRRVTDWIEMRRARRTVAATYGLTRDETRHLRDVSLRVHPSDPMYVPGRAEHYLAVGLSASRVLTTILEASPNGTPRAILDFPCGYGRVLRFLKVMFPTSHIVGGEVDADALKFCRDEFGIDTVLSHGDFAAVEVPRQTFDLVWCGSLMTHLDERAAASLLTMFHGCLADGGLCAFTTHGRKAAGWIRDGSDTYGLPEPDLRNILEVYEASGYGYRDYEGSPGYGISLVTRQRMNELITGSGAWRHVACLESGWDNHQDVYALAKV